MSHSFTSVRFRKDCGKNEMLELVQSKESKEGKAKVMKVLRTENLKKYYGSGESLVKALDGVNLTVDRGEFVAIGRSGLSYGGQRVCGRERYFRAEGGCAVHFPAQEDRFCVPEL